MHVVKIQTSSSNFTEHAQSVIICVVAEMTRCVVQTVNHTQTCADLNMLDAEIKLLDSLAVVIAEFGPINRLNLGHIDRESGHIGHDPYSGQIDQWKSKGRRRMSVICISLCVGTTELRTRTCARSGKQNVTTTISTCTAMDDVNERIMRVFVSTRDVRTLGITLSVVTTVSLIGTCVCYEGHNAK